MLGSMLPLTFNFGTLLAFVIGTYVDYTTCLIVYLSFPIVFMVIFLYFPETPLFLLRKGHGERAVKSIRFYRNIAEGIDSDTFHQSELDGMIQCEMDKIQKTNDIQIAKQSKVTKMSWADLSIKL